MNREGRTKRRPEPLNLSGDATSNVSNLSSSASGSGDIYRDDGSATIVGQQGRTSQSLGIHEPLRPTSSMQDFQRTKEEVGAINSEDLEKIEELGAGSGGIVWKVKHSPTQLIMARKLIHLEVKPVIKNQILAELRVLDQCTCQFIVGFYGAFYSDGEISICMEYMESGSLDKVLGKVGRFPEEVIGKIAFSVLKGLEYLKTNHQIVHRDVKPSNILLNIQGDIKLCDFGVSGQLIDSMANSFVGSRSYMSPERLTGEKYSVASDIWSLGLSLVELALGIYPLPLINEDKLHKWLAASTPPPVPQTATISKQSRSSSISSIAADMHRDMQLPFGQDQDISIFSLLTLIVNEDPPSLPIKYFSLDLKCLTDQCLKKQPHQRPSLAEALAHTFVAKAENDTFTDMAAWVKQA